MKHLTLHYTQVELIQAANRMRFASLTEFTNYITHHNLSGIFSVTNAANIITNFAVMHNNMLLEHPNLGFNKLEEYHAATNYNFPDAATYYLAQQAGYKKYEDYQLVQQAGIAEKETLEKIKQTGFMKGFDDYMQYLQTNPQIARSELAPLTNAYMLYQFATTNGFDKYDAFKAALEKGFTNIHMLNVANELQFPDYATYNQALQCGFRTYDELQIALQNNIRNSDDFTRFVELSFVGDQANTFDERLLMVLLSKIEQGKRLSLNKLYDGFQRALNEYQYPDTNQLPAWFTQQFNDKAVFNQFVSTNKQLKKYGDYDHDGEFFQINKMQDRKVVLDGSNVAHNSGGKPNTLPTISNLVTMVQFLKQQGFTDIAIIVDASLKKKIHDPEKINILTEMAEYLVAPPENSADLFIIQYVKAKHCLLVSNDTFREWKIKDVWVAENIDYYRLSFMIKDNEVLMPDLK